MLERLWDNFPALLEQNINSLLEGAYPRRDKAYFIYKACLNEGLWDGDYEVFLDKLLKFYKCPREARMKGQFDRFLKKPMGHDIFKQFVLNFRTAEVDDTSLRNLASWTHNLIRVGRKMNTQFTSQRMIEKTLKQIVNPGPKDKVENIEFEDFTQAWENQVFRAYGEKYKNDLGQLVNELHRMKQNLKLKTYEKPQILTHTLSHEDIDWLMDLREAAYNYEPAPKHPKGSQLYLSEVERMVSLYKIVQSTRLGELRAHREKIRYALIDRCDHLIRTYCDKVS